MVQHHHLEKNHETYKEHGFINWINEVAAGLYLVQREGALVVKVVLLVLEEHPVGELHVVPTRGAPPRLRHPAMLEGRHHPEDYIKINLRQCCGSGN
jgi:hypothetical protein